MIENGVGRIRYPVLFLVSCAGVALSPSGAPAHDCLWWWTNVTAQALLDKQYGLFQESMTGPIVTVENFPGRCALDCFDVDDDGDVDLYDWARFNLCRQSIEEKSGGTSAHNPITCTNRKVKT